ncbi:uncharacterized protein LOC127873688 [Dreissena polymorpha]|uniref:uncharacterized protein LOC127873688 n=1 Tax=Dreissena polymorpha TaxID=45954 RepID=UPI002264EBE7|nr:uncharacterized protein LOC127873688 [Dreissena polymorpha]
MSLKMFVFVVAAVVYLAGVSDALKCHVCVGTGGDACSDGSFDANASLVSSEDGCGGSCVTVTASSVVTRACYPSSMASGCTTATLIGVETKTCYCDTDLCNAGTAASSQNGAERAGVSMISASILAGLTLVARSFM